MPIDEEDSREGSENECEGRPGWMIGGRAGMASSETGIAKFYLDNDEAAGYLCSSFGFNVI